MQLAKALMEKWMYAQLSHVCVTVGALKLFRL